MQLTSGTRLGPYEVVAPIGAGGMGEVYRARDTRLDRTVAIKLIGDGVSLSGQLRERFEREAKAISALAHPHICTLFDVGQHDGREYLVMEYLEGESLADRLAKGPLPTEQVARYGAQIADALYAAHRQGIIHRDLKPANVMLTKSGTKLLDFGLAKTNTAAIASADEATQHKALTAEGTLVGTFQYMAPEQLEGKEADARTDIFALGATLYEMATGRRAFDGKSRASVIASILDRDPPPISAVQPMTPPALDRVVRTCLAKDPDDRWQSAHDVAAELKWISDSSSEVAAVHRRAMPRRMVWAAVALAAGVAIGAAAMWLSIRDRKANMPVARFAISLPPAAPIFFGGQVALAISPDGTRFVYRAKEGNDTRLYLRSIGQLSPTPIGGTENAVAPAFSPDGGSIVFLANQKLKKIALDGGLQAVLADSGGLGSAWHGHTIYYTRTFSGGIWSVPDHGGEPRQVLKTDPQKGARALVWPDVLPDGKTILVTVWNNGTWDDARIVAYPIDGGEPKVIIDGGTCARYVATGHLLFGRAGTLYAAPFDLRKLQAGTPVPVVSGVVSGVTNGEVQYAVSGNGSLLFAPGGVLQEKRTLLWIDRRGNEQPVVATQRPYGAPALSPDGQTIAITLETATYDVWQLDTDRDTMTRVSFGGDDSGALWTPDGRRIIWNSSRPGHENLFSASADNSGSEERLTSSNEDQAANSITPDGRLIAVTRHSGTGDDIMLVDLAGEHKERPFLTSRFNETGASFSPDGRWMVYLSNESGRNEVYLRPFPGAGGKWQVSVDGARGCQWAHNGHEIIYRKQNKFFAVPVQTQPQVRIGKPQLLFEKDLQGGWDISRDDQRILCVRQETPPIARELHIVLNWFPELKRRVR